MRKLWGYWIGFALLGSICSSAQAQTQGRMSLSDLLPVELVQKLIADKLWRADWDSAQNADGQELTRFWEGFKSESVPASSLVESLFGAYSIEEGRTLSKPELYTTKFAMLRYLVKTSNLPKGIIRERITQIESMWRGKYVELALATAQISGVEELKPMANLFREKVKSKQVQIVDLSPEERARLATLIPASHGIDILAKDPTLNSYRIRGVYHAMSRYFAVDFSKPIEETLVTFIHEMVHAADPALEAHRAIYKEKFEASLKVLAKLLGRDGLDLPEFKNLEIAFASSELDELTELIRELRKTAATRTAQEVKEAKLELTGEERATLSAWIRAGVGLTIENEYRAYGFSLLAYASLSARLALLPPDPDRREFMERFLAGDDVFVLGLLASHSPFKGVGFAGFSRTAQERVKFSQVMSLLQLVYLEQTETFLQSLAGRFSSELKRLGYDPSRQSVLPDWALPGGFDLPTNPYTVLNARITTAAVVRFQQALTQFAEQVRNMNTPLMTLSVGVLDLSDVSFGEQQLIGVRYTGSKFSQVAANLPAAIRDGTIDPRAARYFDMVTWKPTPTPEERTVSAFEIAKNLIGLRLLKTISWIDTSLGGLQVTGVGSRVFLQKLRERLITDSEEMSAERVKELEVELEKNLEALELTKDQVYLNTLALDYLGQLYEVANRERFFPLARELKDRSEMVYRLMDDLNIPGKENFATGMERIQNEGASLLKQLEPHVRECSKESKDFVPMPARGPFLINGSKHGFHLMLICYKKKIHAVRLPGDTVGHMTTIVEDGIPTARIPVGSRGIRLFPIFSQTGGSR